MTSMIRIRKLAGFEIPSIYDLVKETSTVKADPVELTEMQWALIAHDEKCVINEERMYMIYESGTLKVVPVKTISNAPKCDSVTPFESNVDSTKSDGGDSEKTGEDMIDAVKAGKKKDDTDEVVKEDAEAMAKKLISTIKAGKRLDDTKQTDTDANADPSKDVDTLGDEKIADGDEGDTEFNPLKKAKEEDSRDEFHGKKPVGEKWDNGYETPKSKKGMFDGKSQEELKSELDSLKKSGPHAEGSSEFTKERELEFALRAKHSFGKVEESAEEVAARIIAAVKAGNAPHEAENPSDTPEKKSLTFDYNGDIGNQTSVDAARANNDSAEKPGNDEKTGEDTLQKSLEVPSEVTSQIDQRISELKSAQAEFDNKGYNDTSVKQNAIDFLEKVKEHLGKGDVEGFQQAQILFQTLMSPITDLLPAGLVLFLGTGANKKATTGESPETL